MALPLLMVCFLSLYHLPPHSAKTTLPRAETQNAGKRGREERQKREKAGKARGARPAPRKGTGAPPQHPAGGNDSPRAPSAGRAKGGGKAKALLRLAVALEALCRGRHALPAVSRAGRGKAWHTACGRQPQCERALRARSRRPTPSRLCRAVVSKEGMAR